MKQIIATVLALLSITAFSKDKDGKVEISEEQKAKMHQFLGEDLAKKVIEAIVKDPEGTATEQKVTDEIVAGLSEKVNAAAANESKLAKQLATEQKARKAAETAQAEAEEKATAAEEKIEKLSKKPEPEPAGQHTPIMKNDKKWVPSGNDTHLFGQQDALYAIDAAHPYNQRAYAALMAIQGVNYLSPKAASLDYTSLKNDLGDFYRIRKQDRIQSFLQELPSLTSIFPLESGYQDQAVLINLFMEEFSQADSTIAGSDFEQVSKGGYKFEPEIIRMWDVMFATTFKQLKALEKNWLGYLNREGSSTMKWSFIEYILVETAKKLKNEQELRRVLGVRKEPTANVPGIAMQASDGLLKFIKNQIALFKIQPFAMGEWDNSNIDNYIFELIGIVPQVLRDSGRLVLYMSTNAVTMYHKNRETLYGTHQDYKPNEMVVHEYPSVALKAVPNMGASKRMIITFEGNLILLEDQPGEMLNFNIEQQDWTLKVWSNWKESLWAYMVGKKFAAASEFPGDYSTQMIFCNDVDEPASYFINMEKNDVTPSVLNHTSLASVANSQATAITDIDDAVIGQVIRLQCNNATNAVTIAKAGKFSLISAAWTPEVGDVIYLTKRSDGKFIEIKRETITLDAIVIDPDDATPDVSEGTKFVTSANVAPTVITDLDNAVSGTVYTLYGGSDDNASTIANAGNFSLTAAMTLDAGSFIILQAAADGIFYEINRG